MANINTINIGNVVNDGLGDDLRTAFQKVNANFSALNSELTIDGLNLDNTGVGVFKQKAGSTLEFKSLKEGRDIELVDSATNILIRSTAPDAFIRFDTDSGSVLASQYEQLTLEGVASTGVGSPGDADYHPGSVTGRQDIEVSAIGSNVKFKTVLPVTDILTVYDFGYIDGAFVNVAQFTLAWTNVDFGTFDYPSSVDLDLGSFI
jgi:hypothetical protein